MSDSASDSWLDAQLRDVPLPSGLIERLKGAIAPADEQIDAALGDVAVPASVLLRLREIPADVAVDEVLVSIAAPPALIHDLRLPTTASRLRRFGRQVARLALAAAWFMAISVALAAGGGAMLTGVFPIADDFDLVVIQTQPLSIYSASSAREPEEISIDGEGLSELPRNLQAAYAQAAYAQSHSALEQPISRVDAPEFADLPVAGPVAQFVSLLNSGFRPMDDAVLLRWGVLGSPHFADDDLPDLTAPQMPRAAGIEPPLVRGYDRQFFLKHRVFPPISPAADAKLADVCVPLLTESDVLGRLEQTAREQRTPAAQEVRVEELIAAMNYHLPAAPTGKLALRTAAGPSPFSSNEAGLLFVGVQAGAFNRREQPSTHLVLAVDYSHSMSRAGRLEMLQTAIDRLTAQLGPHDRLSLVVFNEEVVQVVESATRADAAAIRDLLRQLTPRGGTNLAAGLQQAASLAMTSPVERTTGAARTIPARRLVLITDSQATLTAETAASIDEVLLAAADTGVRLDVLDLSFRDGVDPLLERWAHSLEGESRQIRGSRQLAWALLESLAGREATIAKDARLTLHFNPQTVAAYRLVGHEANALADLTPPAVEAEFAAGESAAALVELWFHPGDGDDLGSAELTWANPNGSEPLRVRQRISRLQFAPTLAESPIPLLKAALAAEVGETLRGSHEALRQAGARPARHRGLAAVQAAARQANSRLRNEADLQRLLRLTREFQKGGLK